MSSLVVAFVACGGRAFEDAEATLERAIVAGKERWSSRFEIEPRAFVEHLARHVEKEGADGERKAASAFAALHVADLYLTHACASGNGMAITTFESEVFAPAIAYARRVHARSDNLVDEAAQRLRVRLIVREPDREPTIATYAGRSPLEAWLRVAIIREVRQLLRGAARTEGSEEGDEAKGIRSDERALRVGSPELALLKREGGVSINDAVDKAVLALGERDRALLRLHFIEGMSVTTLGRIYHVHASTMSRRLQDLRANLLEVIKRDLSLGTTSVHDLSALVASQFDMHLSEVLRRET